ncbi:MAG: ATP-binding cassette domain-containing protein [Streptococcaceae bacterium]|jgi:polar amino acid transport system ATP-binding protein|nr:ATP-binding cassette domain-containing protein [Streptococcaceae bacterium]
MLEIKQLSKTFGAHQIFDGFDLRVPDHQVLAIAGPSGGGKTTLLRILAGLETLDSGEIYLNDAPLALEKGRLVNSPLGFVFQDFQLFPHMTVAKNLWLSPVYTQGVAKDVAQQKAKELLVSLELRAQADAYPYSLSGGQKQRVALARALMMAPELVGYDEPTSALDPALRDNIAELILANKSRGITQIVVTHDMDFAEKVADTMLEINPRREK